MIDVRTGHEVRAFGKGEKSFTWSETFSPSGRYVIMTVPDPNPYSDGDVMRLFSLPDMQGLRNLQERNEQGADFTDYVFAVEHRAWSLDERYLLVTGFDRDEKRPHGLMYDVESGRLLDIQRFPFRKDHFIKVQATSDGNFVIVGQHPTQPGLRLIRWKP